MQPQQLPLLIGNQSVQKQGEAMAKYSKMSPAGEAMPNKSYPSADQNVRISSKVLVKKDS
jgi:hypothetical protein